MSGYVDDDPDELDGKADYVANPLGQEDDIEPSPVDLLRQRRAKMQAQAAVGTPARPQSAQGAAPVEPSSQSRGPSPQSVQGVTIENPIQRTPGAQTNDANKIQAKTA